MAGVMHPTFAGKTPKVPMDVEEAHAEADEEEEEEEDIDLKKDSADEEMPDPPHSQPVPDPVVDSSTSPKTRAKPKKPRQVGKKDKSSSDSKDSTSDSADGSVAKPAKKKKKVAAKEEKKKPEKPIAKTVDFLPETDRILKIAEEDKEIAEFTIEKADGKRYLSTGLRIPMDSKHCFLVKIQRGQYSPLIELAAEDEYAQTLVNVFRRIEELQGPRMFLSFEHGRFTWSGFARNLQFTPTRGGPKHAMTEHELYGDGTGSKPMLALPGMGCDGTMVIAGFKQGTNGVYFPRIRLENILLIGSQAV